MKLQRSIANVGRGYRHLGRYRQVLTILARYGFGELLDRLPIRRYVKVAWGEAEHHVANLRAAQRLRYALAELGPTFVKLGQVLSTRTDLVPIEFARELAKLQDQAPTFSAEDARSRIESELGSPIAELFEDFEAEPCAAASFAQVHRARLRDSGEWVALKVQRPGVQRVVETDLEILDHLAAIVERHGEGLLAQPPHVILTELRAAIERELDYTREAAHLKRFGRLFSAEPAVKIPAVFTDLTTPRLLTMEWLDGLKVSEIVAQGRPPEARERLAERGADAMLRQIFVFGHYHADPHPGNVLILDQEVVAFIDFGQIGRLTAPMRLKIAEFFLHLTEDDIESAARAFLTLTSATAVEPTSRHQLETEIGELVDWHLDRPVGEIQLGLLIWRLLEIAHRYHREVDSELFLVFKALATVEGLARELAPDFDLRSRTGPILEEVLRQRWSLGSLQRGVWESGLEVSELLQEAPRDVRALLRQLREGELTVAAEVRGLHDLHRAHEGAVNRLSFAVVLAALLIASSLLALGDFPDWWQGLPLLGVAGYLLSGVIGFRLLWSIFRKGGL